MAEKGTEEVKKKHTLSLSARTQAEISGVTEVESFDEHSVVLVTDCGDMTVEGEGLHVSTLDIARGIVEISGQIGGIYYSDASAPPKGFRARFFG